MAVEPAEAEEIRNHLLRYTGWDKVPDEVVKTLDLSLRSVQRRLASFLYSLAIRSGAEQGKPHVIPRALDMNTVAARLGTVREEISRALNRMQREGILKLSRQEIVVLDLSALEAVTYE